MNMNHLPTFLKGFAMGAANVIPGVSGGTIAFVTGIYERLIDAIKSFDGESLKLLVSRDFKGLWKHVDGTFLLALMSGVIFSILSLAKVLEVVLENDVYKVYVSALFFGLILASVWLLLLGNYKLIMVDSVNALRRGEAEALSILIPVGIGAVAGLAILSRVLSWLFKRFHDVAVASITGFVAGSLITIWPWKREVIETFTSGDKVKEKVVDYDRFLPAVDGQFWITIAIMAAGVALMVGVELMGSKKGKE